MTMNELIKAVADAYKNPAEGEEDRNGNTRLAVLQEKFRLSSLKVQKILVTAGVYEPVKEGTPYVEITRLRKAGKSAKEIMKITGLSNAAVSAYIPYERGVYHADRSGAEISSAAERKRKQRGGEETKRMNARSVLQGNVTDESFWKAIQEHGREIFISTNGERYSVNARFTAPELTAPEKGEGAAGRRQELQIRLIGGGELFFPKEMAIDVLHNALDLMAEGEETEELSFDRTEALPYVYPLLVFFGIIPGDKAQYTTRRMIADAEVCSCCGRMADYTVRSYADLINIAMEIEEAERSKWDPAERERVERMEASHGRVKWYERARKSTAAIRAFNREGERHFCRLCAETIRMALEDGELPSAAAPADYQALSLEAAEAGFYRYFDRMPEGVRYVDRYGTKYDSGAAGDEGRSRIFVHTERDRDGAAHTFACYVRKFPGHRSFEAVEVHRLTKAGRLARDYTGTDYEFRTGMREEENKRSVGGDSSSGDVERDGGADGRSGAGSAAKGDGVGSAASERLRKMYIGFLELADHIRDALQNPTLDWHEEFPHLGNAVDIGGRQCTLESIGEMEVVYLGTEPGEIGRQRGREWRGGEYGFMIDGRIFTGEEVALMSSAHEGWKMQYRFADPSDRPLRRGEYLMPVQLGEKELVTEVSELLNLFAADGRFISEHDERNFGILFEKEVLKKLKLYHESNPRGYGKLAGMKIIERLGWIEGTERQAELVREVVGR